MKSSKKDFPIKIGETTYMFRYNFDALTLIEDLTGKSFGVVLSESSLSTWKIVVFAGLKKNHPDIALENVGDLIDDAENLGSLKLRVQGALLNSLGVERKEDDTKKKDLPLTSQTGV